MFEMIEKAEGETLLENQFGFPKNADTIKTIFTFRILTVNIILNNKST